MTEQRPARPQRNPSLTVFRVTEHDPPTPSDFLSDREAGFEPLAGESSEDRDGRSSWIKLNRARDFAKWRMRKGAPTAFVASVDVTPASGFRAEQRGDDKDHYQLWGDKNRLAVAAKTVWRPDR